MGNTFILHMRDYLVANCLQYDDAIHVMVAQRNAGKVFSLENHIAGLVYAQLTNQTKWSRIVPHLKEIDALFFHYDPQRIKEKDSNYYTEGLFALKCGNISTKAQMKNLHRNIETMERIIAAFGSMDAFVLSAPAYKIVEMLSSSKSEYKMHQLGEALAWEYIRNVGIDACKPDTHLRRFLGNARMGRSADAIASVEETIAQVEAISADTGLPLAVIDNIIWSFCADGYGEVCTATPHCERCVVRHLCNSPESKRATNIPSISYAEIRSICSRFDNDPQKIGQYFIDLLMHNPELTSTSKTSG